MKVKQWVYALLKRPQKTMLKHGYIFTNCQELANGVTVLKITVTDEKRGSMQVMGIRAKGKWTIKQEILNK